MNNCETSLYDQGAYGTSTYQSTNQENCIAVVDSGAGTGAQAPNTGLLASGNPFVLASLIIGASLLIAAIIFVVQRSLHRVVVARRTKKGDR